MPSDPTYIPPDAVKSPKDRWQRDKVLRDGGPHGWSVARGKWDGEPRLAIRWNGDEERPRGNPLSNANPTWFMLPEELEFGLLFFLEWEEKDRKAPC